MPNPNEFGNNYNKFSLLYDDGIQPISKIYGTFRFITIFSVNDAPQIWYFSPDNGTSLKLSGDDTSLLILDPVHYQGDIQINGTTQMTIVIGSGYNFGFNFVDEDAGQSTNMEFNIVITQRPETKKNEVGPYGYFTGFNGTTTEYRDRVSWTSSIEQANLYVATLSFNAESQGDYQIQVTVKDNGATGRYCPPGKYYLPGQTSCPRTTVANIYAAGLTNTNAVVALSTGVGAGVLALAAIGTLIGAKFFKPKETQGWNEWNEENIGDVALSNPFYEQETRLHKNSIYESGRSGSVSNSPSKNLN